MEYTSRRFQVKRMSKGKKIEDFDDQEKNNSTKYNYKRLTI